MTRDEALLKIKKCLALAASPEPHEAAAALRQAQKLMEQFGLSETEVSLADVSESPRKAPSVPLVIWEAALAHAVAEVFGCEYFTRAHLTLAPGGSYRKERQFVFVGVGMAAEVAGYAFDVLARQCARDRRAHMGLQSKNCKPKTKVARGDLYATGWVSGVRALLQAFAGNSGDQALVTRYMAHQYPAMEKAKFKDRTTGKNVKHDDFERGHKAGRSAELNHGIAASAALKQIGGRS